MESNDNPQPICFLIPIIYQLDNVLMLYTVVYPNLDLKGGTGFLLFALPAFFPSVFLFFFCTQNKERGVGPLKAPPLDLPLMGRYSVLVTQESLRVINDEDMVICIRLNVSLFYQAYQYFAVSPLQ